METKRRGRPPKNQTLTNEQTAEIVQKKRQPSRTGEKPLPGAPQSLERYATANSEEVSDMLHSVMRWYGRKPVKTDEECAERLNEFFRTLAETGELPSTEKLALALGVTRQSIWNWENGIKASAERTQMIQQAKELLAAMDAELVSRGKIPQVTYIFRAKNFFGMKDQTDVVVTPNNPIGAEVSENELRKRIEGDVIIDAEDFE